MYKRVHEAKSITRTYVHTVMYICVLSIHYAIDNWVQIQFSDALTWKKFIPSAMAIVFAIINTERPKENGGDNYLIMLLSRTAIG